MGVRSAMSNMHEQMLPAAKLPARKRRVKAANAKAATDIKSVAQILQHMGFEPIEMIVKALTDDPSVVPATRVDPETGEVLAADRLNLAEKVRSALGLAEYVYPKLARQEGKIETDITLRVICDG